MWKLEESAHIWTTAEIFEHRKDGGDFMSLSVLSLEKNSARCCAGRNVQETDE
jgi:hypothetical protein